MQVNLQTSAPYATEVQSLQQSLKSQNNPTTITEAARSQIESDVKSNISEKGSANSNISSLTGKGMALDIMG